MRGQTNASNIGGTIGSDTKPIKIVNGVATPVTNHLGIPNTFINTQIDVTIPPNTNTVVSDTEVPDTGTYLVVTTVDYHEVGNGTQLLSVGIETNNTGITWMRNHAMLPNTYQREGFAVVWSVNQGDHVKIIVASSHTASPKCYGRTSLIRLI